MRVSGLMGRSANDLREVTFLVDTGSFYTVVTPAVAAALQLPVVTQAPLILANSSRVMANLSMAYLDLMDRQAGIPVAIIDAPETLLGVTALEGLGLKVNPVEGKLEYDRPYGPALLVDGPED